MGEDEESRECVCGGEKEICEHSGAHHVFCWKKLTGRKESYGQPEKQHCGRKHLNPHSIRTQCPLGYHPACEKGHNRYIYSINLEY